MPGPNLIFGNPTAPNSVEVFLDALFTTTIANYKRTMTDSISATNAVFHKIMGSDQYESADGGTYLTENLMYALAQADTYAGYDLLSTLPMDGLTQAIFDWAQVAVPIAYDMTAIRKNGGSREKLVDLVKTKIQQGEMGLQEGFARFFMWGNKINGGNLYDPYIGGTGAPGMLPLPALIRYNSGTESLGGISVTTNTWWGNHSKVSAATTYFGFLKELENLWNTCSLGAGGAPNLVMVDQVTMENYVNAYFSVFKSAPGAPNQVWPFEAKKFMNTTADIVMDDKVPDVESGIIPTFIGGQGDSSTLTYGTAYMVNTKFLKVRYMEGMDFTMLKDENGKTFKKPINGDSRVGHMAWMGASTITNRRKHGVLGKIARTYAS